MAKERNKHHFWLNIHGQIVKESGNLFLDLPDDFSPKLLCPILSSIFSEIVKLEAGSPPVFIPAVNVTSKWINGYFDYLLSKEDDGLILWEVRDTTESNNTKLIRLQPEMEQKLRDDTQSIMDSDKSCDSF